MNQQEINFAIQCFSKYISIYKKEKGKNPTEADIDHSALLNRLLSGKGAFPNPPPKMWGSPAYALFEGESVQIHEINFWALENEFNVVINQGIGWKWIEKNGDINCAEWMDLNFFDRYVIPSLDRVNAIKLPITGVLEYKDGSQYDFFWKDDAQNEKRMFLQKKTLN